MFGLFPSYKLEEIELIIFFKSYHTNICTSSLYEFAILHSKTSWIIQVVSHKSFFNVAALRTPVDSCFLRIFIDIVCQLGGDAECEEKDLVQKSSSFATWI